MYKIYTINKGMWKTHVRKLLFIMRLTIVIILATLFQLRASTTFGQKLNYVQKKVTIARLFDEIQKQTGYRVLWPDEKLKGTTIISANFKNADIEDVMETSLTGLQFTYTIKNKNIILTEKEKSIVDRISSLFSAIDITGKVVDETGKGLPGATVKVKGSTKTATTNADGFFTLTNVDDKATLVISFLGYDNQEVKASEDLGTITLSVSSGKLEEVEIVSTGYQTLPKERATGSFTLIDNKTINRSVSSDILTRLNGITNGLLFDSKVGNATGISIRGRSTIFSNTTPLIVVDNFPFQGDIKSLNPDMIESITLLKDAAAASIWGAFSGNGVIVITTKRGKLYQPTAITIKADLTIGEKPDLYYKPQLTSSEFIDVEKFLFEKGAYTAIIDDGYSTISPVVAILQKIKLDPSYATQGMNQIDALKNIDYREQQNKYFYRNSTQQRYYADIRGGENNGTYYFSAGFDKNLPNVVAISSSRVNLKGSNSYNLLKNRLQLNSDISYSKSKSLDHLNGRDFTGYLPYEQIADLSGNPLPIVFSGGLRDDYTNTAGTGNLLDWKYRPLDELRNRHSTSNGDVTDYRINLGLKLNVISSLNFSINYQYYSANTKLESNDSRNSYYTRNLINTYSQINNTTKNVTRPVPLGDIYTPEFSRIQSNNARAQFDFKKTFRNVHAISALAGYDIMDYGAEYNRYTLYGYNPETGTSVTVDPISLFPSYVTGGTSTIGTPPYQNGSINRQISWYGNASYTYDNKYVASGSFRKDASNLFGVKANQKGVPLWSAGILWNLHKESFFAINWLSSLQLKTTYGYNGNVNNSISAYLTAEPRAINTFSKVQYFQVANPPNENLRWERVKNVNFGMFFSTKNDVVSGSIEYYVKDGLDLIASSPIAPQTGISLFTGNTANTHAKGVDIQLNSKNINGDFKWSTIYIFNYVKDKVTDYKTVVGTNNSVVSAATIAPIVGYPINSIFAFKWGGLNAMGNPQGYLGESLSVDYTKIRNSTDVTQLQFFGSKTPMVYGGFRNTFSYKELELSLNVSYKLKYYFRRTPLSSSLFSGNFKQPDYNIRWQQPGDELITDVPSLVYPANSARTAFYQYSAALIERGDNIRFQDIQLNYTMTKKQFPKMPFEGLNIYVYANNLGLLWKDNHHGLDPDASAYPNPKTIAIGVKTTF